MAVNTLSVISLLDRYPEMINRTIDLTFATPVANGQRIQRGLPDPSLSRFYSMTRYPATKLALQKIQERKPTIASIVGVDGEYPVRREAVAMNIELIGSCKLARGVVFTEEDFDLLREAEMYLASNNPEAYAAFIERYLQTPAYLTQSVMILAALLCIQVMHSAASTYIDPETNLGYELSYLSQVPATNIPAALSGGALWSAPTTATPLANLKDHLNVYYGNVFTLPEAIVMSSTVADAMLNANDTKNKIARMRGSITSEADFTAAALANISRPTIEEVRQWLAMEITTAAQGSVTIPEMIVSEAEYYPITAATGDVGAGVKFFPSNKYFFAMDGMVEGAFVPTATNDYASSMAFVTEELSRAPRRERAAIDTRFLALCPDPRYLGWRQVL